MKITLATSNKNKVNEINLSAKNYDIEFILPEGEFDPEENGTNFLENAYIKAKAASLKGSTELYLADDSGLCVDYLKGKPGIYSSRYASDSNKRIDKLLNELKGVKNRDARFVCAMVLINKKGDILYKIEAQCDGTILNERKGEGGFGYDPVFFVKSENMSMAELTKEKKAQISHRALALNGVLNYLKNEVNK